MQREVKFRPCQVKQVFVLFSRVTFALYLRVSVACPAESTAFPFTQSVKCCPTSGLRQFPNKFSVNALLQQQVLIPFHLLDELKNPKCELFTCVCLK